jgi:hypothetical protein
MKSLCDSATISYMDQLNNQFQVQFQQIPDPVINPKDDKGKEERDPFAENPVVDIQNQDNPELHIQDQDPNPNPILDIEEQDPERIELRKAGEDKVVLRRVTSPKPGFIGRWGSFIKFLRDGRDMDGKIHLRSEYKIEDEPECIEKPVGKPKAEGQNPEFHIEDEDHELPSPLHYFNENEPVRQKAKGELKAHITDEKNVDIADIEERLPYHQKTVYTVDGIYRQTGIDENTRTTEEDFWLDKESKCFTIAGVSLGIAIVALITLPIVTALAVAAVAGAVLYLMLRRVSEATPEVYAWRDTLQEYYAKRQMIGFEQREDHDGAHRLQHHYQNYGEDLIGKVFHPEEAWKFWQTEWTAYEEEFTKILAGEEEIDDDKLNSFFLDHPYSSYDYITQKLNKKDPLVLMEHLKHRALSEKYLGLEDAFETTTRQYLEDKEDLAKLERQEVEKKKTYQDKITDAHQEMIKELGDEPTRPLEGEEESEEHKNWSTKAKDINDVQKHYLDQIDEAFEKRESAFKIWSTDRDLEIEKNKDVSREKLFEPVELWWNLRQNFNVEGWNADQVIIPENIHNKEPVTPPKTLPQIPEVITKIDEEKLKESGKDLEIAKNFFAKIK